MRLELLPLVDSLAIDEAAIDRLLLVVGPLLRRHLPEIGRILRAPAIPAGEVPAVEEGREARRGDVLFGHGRNGEGNEQGDEADDAWLHSRMLAVFGNEE